jgi:hypothetical protein
MVVQIRPIDKHELQIHNSECNALVFIIITECMGQSDIRAYGLQLGLKINQKWKMFIPIFNMFRLIPCSHR